MKHSQILSCLVCLINILLSSVSVVYPVIKDTTTNKLRFNNLLCVCCLYKDQRFK